MLEGAEMGLRRLVRELERKARRRNLSSPSQESLEPYCFLSDDVLDECLELFMGLVP
jgi:hypothetical protein